MHLKIYRICHKMLSQEAWNYIFEDSALNWTERQPKASGNEVYPVTQLKIGDSFHVPYKSTTLQGLNNRAKLFGNSYGIKIRVIYHEYIGLIEVVRTR